jgi:RNA polymerase sigma-70 factor (ECF subfamily)
VTDAEMRAIYRETIDDLYGYISRRCGGEREIAEDITQETWLRAVRDWHRKGVPDKPIAWLTTVARNILLNEFRRKPAVPIESVPAGQLLDAMERGAAPESPAAAAIVNHALARLPREQRSLLEAFHFENRRVSDLASTLGVSERAVEGRLRRAREKLRRHLEAAIRRNGDSHD